MGQTFSKIRLGKEVSTISTRTLPRQSNERSTPDVPLDVYINCINYIDREFVLNELIIRNLVRISGLPTMLGFEVSCSLSKLFGSFHFFDRTLVLGALFFVFVYLKSIKILKIQVRTHQKHVGCSFCLYNGHVTYIIFIVSHLSA